MGYGAVLQCIWLDSYYIVVMAWALFYFFNSLTTCKFLAACETGSGQELLKKNADSLYP